eukprot:7690056-Pyramimonas_sp.AAC.1
MTPEELTNGNPWVSRIEGTIKAPEVHSTRSGGRLIDFFGRDRPRQPLEAAHRLAGDLPGRDHGQAWKKFWAYASARAAQLFFQK